MARPFDYAKRDELVKQATDVLARTGVIDTSLRALAAEMGTSARMLIYYFGSKEQLILAVMTGLQQQNVPEPELCTTAEELRQWCLDDWHLITRGDQRSRLRILEQVFGAACGQDSPYARYTADTLAQLTRNAQLRMEAIGMPAPIAETRARLALAAIQGLVIDFFTTTDPDRVDDTHRRMVDDLILAPFEPEAPRRQRRPPATSSTRLRVGDNAGRPARLAKRT
ncbi:TetR/AcrR family transcriptional regulator [Mycolicibacterium komossense]|uniref:TetR/AcrR family transcriptional regulator n=1 Tax=Mycolicibacterium komossense TaxID=1779 RepID=A0ABT3C9T7_9MYCO|nr:TetR/AcrR family transcriptional regulator [Mycolicibacterium komossense]MCV7226242.1 TetR/AcrR family transcriptional regulator [Mycolicibacterium komossense]